MWEIAVGAEWTLGCVREECESVVMGVQRCLLSDDNVSVVSAEQASAVSADETVAVSANGTSAVSWDIPFSISTQERLRSGRPCVQLSPTPRGAPGRPQMLCLQTQMLR